MFDDEVVIVLILGLTGSGKTAIVDRIMDDLQKEEEIMVFGKISCKNMESFKNDLLGFRNRNNLDVDDTSESSESFDFFRKLLEKMYKENGGDESSKMKSYLFLDDVNLDPRRFKALLMEIAEASKENHLHNTRLLITTQLDPHLKHLDVFKEIDTVAVLGFTEKNARDYLKKYVPEKKMDDVIQALSLLPVDLSAFKGILASNMVRDYSISRMP